MRQVLQTALEALKMVFDSLYVDDWGEYALKTDFSDIEVTNAITTAKAALAEQRLQATDKVASSPEVATLEPYGYVIEQGEYKTGFFDADAKREVEFLVSQHGGRVIRLYTAPPQRKPLSDDEIQSGQPYAETQRRWAFKKGVRFAEKKHGIGEQE